LPYGAQLVSDVLNRTETAMPQAHCFLGWSGRFFSGQDGRAA